MVDEMSSFVNNFYAMGSLLHRGGRSRADCGLSVFRFWIWPPDQSHSENKRKNSMMIS